MVFALPLRALGYAHITLLPWFHRHYHVVLSIPHFGVLWTDFWSRSPVPIAANLCNHLVEATKFVLNRNQPDSSVIAHSKLDPGPAW